jgi:hypothetical protein
MKAKERGSQILWLPLSLYAFYNMYVFISGDRRP